MVVLRQVQAFWYNVLFPSFLLFSVGSLRLPCTALEIFASFAQTNCHRGVISTADYLSVKLIFDKLDLYVLAWRAANDCTETWVPCGFREN